MVPRCLDANVSMKPWYHFFAPRTHGTMVREGANVKGEGVHPNSAGGCMGSRPPMTFTPWGTYHGGEGMGGARPSGRFSLFTSLPPLEQIECDRLRPKTNFASKFQKLRSKTTINFAYIFRQRIKGSTSIAAFKSLHRGT